MDKTPCPHCGRVGLVRFEVVIQGRDTSLTYYCGYCEKTWQQPDRRMDRPEYKEAPRELLGLAGLARRSLPKVVTRAGLEPATLALKVRCSTTELPGHASKHGILPDVSRAKLEPSRDDYRDAMTCPGRGALHRI